MSSTTRSGRWPATAAGRPSASPSDGDDLVPAVDEQPPEARRGAAPGPRRSRPARQLRDEASCRRRGALDAQRPAVGGDAVGRPLSPDPRRRGAARRRRRLTQTTSEPFWRCALQRDRRGVGVLDRVGEAFAGDEVGGGLDADGGSARRGAAPSPAAGRGRASSLQRRAPGRRPAATGGRPWASSRSSSIAYADSATASSSVWPPATPRPELVLRVAQREPDRDQPLLRAVVQVALDPPALGVAGGDDPRPRRLDLGELAAQLDAQPRDLDRQAAGLDQLGQQVGRSLRRRGRAGRRPAAPRRARSASARARPRARRRPAGRARRRRPRSRAGRSAARAAGRRAPRAAAPRSPPARPGPRAGPPGRRRPAGSAS